MRLRASALALGAIALAALSAGAEQELGPLIVSGEAQVGGRGISGDDDSAKFEDYRDVQEGIFGSLHFLVEDADRRYYLQGWLDDIGEDDEQYRIRGGRYGRWGFRGFYSEIPHLFSNQAVSPYASTGDGVLALRGGFDRTLASDGVAYNSQLTPSTTANPSPTYTAPLGFRTREGSGEIFFRPTSEWDLSAGYRVLDRDGTRAKAFGFGSPGGNYINVPAPIHEKTHEARVDLQYVRETWNLGLNYTGSFFENDLDSFSADNPLTALAAETTGSSAVGRFALAPDNSSHLVSLSGSGSLPTSFPATLAGSFSWGLSLQDDDFLPLTSNQAIVASGDPRLTLPANGLDGRVQTLTGNLLFTARPLANLNVKMRYGIYDYDNDTDELTLAGEAPNDRSLRDGTRTNAYGYTRQNALAEMAWRVPKAPVTATLGFLWERWNRDKEREVRTLDTYGPALNLNWRAARWAHLRAGYAFSARRGTDYEALEGALEGLRKYSQADRLNHRFNLLAQFDPHDSFGVTLTTAFELSDYDDSDQGLTEENRWNIGFDASYRPHARVGLWANYYYDYIWATQEQGGFTWDSTSYDTAHSGGVGVDFVIVPGLLDFSTSYFFQLAHARTEGGGAALDFPTIKDTLHAVTAGFSAYPHEWLTFRADYRWERYDRSNFQEDFPLYTDTQGDIYLQNRVGDYDAHIFSLSAIVKF